MSSSSSEKSCHETYVLASCLKVLLYKHNINLSVQSINSRDRTHFESIIYHLLLTISPSECRQKFRFCYPCRDRQQASEFVRIIIEWLKIMCIPNIKVVPGHLQALGGSGSRNLIAQLTQHTLRLETQRINKRISSLSQAGYQEPKLTTHNFDTSYLVAGHQPEMRVVEQYKYGLEQYNLKKTHLDFACDEMRLKHCEQHRKIQKALDDWTQLTTSLIGKQVPANQVNASSLFRKLDKKLPATIEKIQITTSKLTKLLEEATLERKKRDRITQSQPPNGGSSRGPRRSNPLDIYMQMKDSSNIRFSIDGSSPYLAIQDFKMAFEQFDLSMLGLSESLNKEISDLKRGTLNTPQMRIKLLWFDKIIPRLELTKVESKPNNIVQLPAESIKDILRRYRPSRHDPNSLLKIDPLEETIVDELLTDFE